MLSKVEINEALILTDVRIVYSEKNLSLGNSDFSFHLFFQVLLNVARVRLFKERKMHSVIREIVFYFLFVWVVLLIAYAHRDPYAHHMTQNMENLFVGNYDSLGYRDEDKIDVKRSTASQNNYIKLYEVSTCYTENFLSLKRL